MPAADNAERARVRYADPLYQSALLRDPDPQHAARAVITAFTALDWATAPLDDQLEARLLAALPPTPRWRLHRRRLPGPLPTMFWKLPAQTRLALGLRLLRDMPIPLIATALGRPVEAVRDLLLAGLLRVAGQTLPENAACRACLRQRLDDPAAGRAHLLSCATCPEMLRRVEQVENELTDQLRATVGGLALPRADGAALRAALEGSGGTGAASTRQTRRLVAVVMAVALLVLGVLVLPRGNSAPAEPAAPLTPQEIVERARKQYGSVQPGAAIVHRRWEITLEQPPRTLQADEWVDTGQPARHRMQLVDGKTVEEWQVGDGQGRLRYLSSRPAIFCGPLPAGMTPEYVGTVNDWQVDTAEQARMRAARWQSGAWASGIRYLDLATSAASLRSLGVEGSGNEQLVTLAATGPAITGTLLLVFDLRSSELHSVRELRTDNGRIEARTPWRLIATETITPDLALQQGLLWTYPLASVPKIEARSAPILDRACPLLGSEQARSLPRSLSRPELYGLPDLPAGVERGLLIGGGMDGALSAVSASGEPLEATQVVYVGPGKRLVLWPNSMSIAPAAGSTTSGAWRLRLQEQGPAQFAVSATTRDAPAGDQNRYPGQYEGFEAWAEGWQRGELIALLASVRPLRPDDWARAPRAFYEPKPYDSATEGMLRQIFGATGLRPGQTLHQITTQAVRQAPFLAEMQDPYHTPAAERPATKRIESWRQVDPTGTRYTRTREGTTDLTGKVIVSSWSTDQGWYDYQALANTVVSGTNASRWVWPDENSRLLLRYEWKLQKQPDGSIIGETSQPLANTDYANLPDAQRNGNPWSQEPWLLDTDANTITLRLEFRPDGQPRLREALARRSMFALPALPAPAYPVSLERTTYETSEWLQTVPDERFVFNPPPRAVFLNTEATADSSQQGQALTITTSISDTAQAIGFPVWGWPDNGSFLAFRYARIPSGRPNLSPGWYSDDQALRNGVAVELQYATPRGSVVLTEGPAEPLRRLLQQRPPRWQSSELRRIVVGSAVHDVWMMRSEPGNPDTWVGFEIGPTLIFMEHKGPEAELEELLKQLGALAEIKAP